MLELLWFAGPFAVWWLIVLEALQEPPKRFRAPTDV